MDVNGTAYTTSERDELKSLLVSGTTPRTSKRSRLGERANERDAEAGEAKDTKVHDANTMRAMMLERRPSLKSIKTKVEAGNSASGARRKSDGANEGGPMGRGVNFDKDGNTPRDAYAADGEILGSIDSGTPNFFHDQNALKDDAMGGGRRVPAYALAAIGDSPRSADAKYFDNNEIVDLLMIVHGRSEARNMHRDTETSLETPTLAQVNMLCTAPRMWDRRGQRRETSPDISSEGALAFQSKRRGAASAQKNKRQRTETKNRHGTPEVLSKEEEALRKMKAFSTRGSNLRNVDDSELMDTLIDAHGDPLSKTMKALCLKHNARATAQNYEHEATLAQASGEKKAAETDGEIHAKSRSWTDEEDAFVRALVREHGPKKWAVIADQLVGKTQKQVYARWRDYLQPGLTTRPWAPFEEEHLIKIQEAIGNQWAVLARLLPGRSPNAIKNKFHATRRKFERAPGDGDRDDDEEVDAT